MERQLEIEAGVPVRTAVKGADEILAGILPAGRYATVTHVGHPDALIEVTAALLDWAAAQGLRENGHRIVDRARPHSELTGQRGIRRRPRVRRVGEAPSGAHGWIWP